MVKPRYTDDQRRFEYVDLKHTDLRVTFTRIRREQRAEDFKESDRIRDQLAAMGVVIKYSKEGTTWEIAR